MPQNYEEEIRLNCPAARFMSLMGWAYSVRLDLNAAQIYNTNMFYTPDPSGHTRPWGLLSL
jgi:hypothetical protein